MKKSIITIALALLIAACQEVDLSDPTLNIDDANIVTVLPVPLCVSGWKLGYDGEFLLDPATGAALPCGDNPLLPQEEIETADNCRFFCNLGA